MEHCSLKLIDLLHKQFFFFFHRSNILNTLLSVSVVIHVIAKQDKICYICNVRKWSLYLNSGDKDTRLIKVLLLTSKRNHHINVKILLPYRPSTKLELEVESGRGRGM